MATMTVSLPDPMKDWIEARIRDGEYASASDYVRDLVRRDRARLGQELTLDELRQLVAKSKASGIGTRSVDELFAQAEQVAAARGLLRE
ncbi:type II toxin-antitoxin system ParD family antitoxin [Aerobium aerolatum]|uniref:Antitoxin ParD1/3/4 n=1 Tax=Aquamicrobium aerolatum DSM 21857 TaxID=1121003 RepID=A0A1I3SUS0_9HYPH|nr:type II toxin-antitoxin system ParD family antitoxin [Aquamicrobium aerolatum]SFJ62555.1 antitoxin ParD1/3/4 [Aquamicrobium aerolatum DSM 21857]